MSSPRQVALMLHGLADADRAWLLGRLDPAQVEVLEPLLVELRELGIPADPALTAQALEPIAVHEDAEMRSVMQTMGAITLPQLQLVLADEPQGVIAAILTAGKWPWQQAFLAAQEPAKARSIKDMMRSHPGGAALHRSLIRALSERLGGTRVAQATPAPSWARFAQRIGKMAPLSLLRGRA